MAMDKKTTKKLDCTPADDNIFFVFFTFSFISLSIFIPSLSLRRKKSSNRPTKMTIFVQYSQLTLAIIYNILKSMKEL